MYADRQMSPARAKFHDKQVRPGKKTRFHIYKCVRCGEINKIHKTVRNPRCWLCEVLL